MILRKPYALLIKNFKKIHFFLLILMVFIAFESNIIMKFFNEYISKGTFTRTSFSLSSTYINIYMFLVTVLIVGIAVIIYILMRLKHKPKLLYLIIIGLYLGLIIFFFYIYNTLDIIEISSVSPRSIRIIRDMTTIITYLQYALSLLIGIRAFGFNIKKFNFGEDLAELEIDVTDNEEFELTVGIDPDKIGRSIRKGRREIKYFIIENFFIFTLITSVVVISLSIALFLNIEVYNKVYNQTESFKAGYFVNLINKTYYTTINQRGEEIAPPNKTYVIVDSTFANKDTYPHRINLEDISLVSNNNVYAPSTIRYQSFVDLGVGYNGQKIEAGKSSNFILIFEVDSNINFNKLLFRYRESLKISSTNLEAKYKRVKLNAIEASNIKKESETSIGKSLSFSDSQLNNTKLTINNVQIEDSFIYEATYCYNQSCSTYNSNLTLQYVTSQNILMKLSYEYILDSKATLSNVNSLANLIKTYGLIRYTVGDKTYENILVDRTPDDYNGKDLYYQVPTVTKNATTVDLVIRIRNKEYIYKLK